MDRGKIQALHFSLNKLRELTNKLLGARYQGINFQHDMDPHKKLIRLLAEELRLCEENLVDLAAELPAQEQQKSGSGKTVSVRAHKRVVKKRGSHDEKKTPDPHASAGEQANTSSPEEENDLEENEEKAPLANFAGPAFGGLGSAK